MVIDFPAAEDWKPPHHRAKQFQQPPVAGAVDPRRPRDRDLDAQPLAGVARQSLRFDLRHLVNVAGTQRRLLVRGGVLDVAVHADRAAMDNPMDPRCSRRFDQPPNRIGIHRTIGVGRQASLAVKRRNVIHDLSTSDRLQQRRLVTDVAGGELDSRRGKRSGAFGVAHERANRVAA